MDTLEESQVSVPKLESIFKAAFMQCSIDKDGDLKIEDGGLKVFVKVNPENKVVTFFSIWGLKPGNDAKKMTFINKLNNEYRLVRFCMPRPDKLWCDYQLLYEGGVIPYQIVNTCRLFIRVCKGIVTDDTDDLIA